MTTGEADWGKRWQAGDNSSSYSGLTTFHRHNPDTVLQRLKHDIFPKLITYTKYRAAKSPKVYNPYFVRVPRKVIQSDLIFMRDPQLMVRANNGYQYILIVQDIFSRKIWAKPIKTKNAAAVKDALEQILRAMQPFHKEGRFVIDRGTEYLNRNVLTMLNDYGLKVTHPSDGHAAHVERANLSLQRLLYQHMEERGGARKWLDYLPTAVNNMNNRYHRIIMMSPNEAEMRQNKNKVNHAMSIYRQKAFDKEYKKGQARFKMGDTVRIKKEKRVFARGYKPTFTSEIFKIKHVLAHLPITMYTLEEWDGSNEIEGNFYPEELSLVKGEVFKIERVVRKQKRNGQLMALVKWEGFPAKYNSWVLASEIQKRR